MTYDLMNCFCVDLDVVIFMLLSVVKNIAIINIINFPSPLLMSLSS